MSSKIDKLYSLGVSHNKFPVPLPDGTYFPDYMTVLDARPMEFLANYNRVRTADWDGLTFLDLGCSEGSTTLGLSQMGSTVHGVEGRGDAVARANALRDIVGFERTHFEIRNVNDESAFRDVDGIFNAGILYHLEDPVKFLERCAKHARHFVYVDSGHAPENEAERLASKFAANFGERFTIRHNDLVLQAVNFAEPGNVQEKQGGQRRGPRSGIGNSNSVWLSHNSLIELMAQLGFPHHITIRKKPKIPRMRTCFFRNVPGPPENLGPLPRPLPAAVSAEISISNARKRDIAFLRKSKMPVTAVGRDPLLSRTIADLEANGIAVKAAIKIAGLGKDPVLTRMLTGPLEGCSGFLVSAFEDQKAAAHHLMLLDRFSYIFTSLTMALEHAGRDAGSPLLQA